MGQEIIVNLGRYQATWSPHSTRPTIKMDGELLRDWKDNYAFNAAYSAIGNRLIQQITLTEDNLRTIIEHYIHGQEN